MGWMERITLSLSPSNSLQKWYSLRLLFFRSLLAHDIASEPWQERCEKSPIASISPTNILTLSFSWCDRVCVCVLFSTGLVSNDEVMTATGGGLETNFPYPFCPTLCSDWSGHGNDADT